MNYSDFSVGFPTNTQMAADNIPCRLKCLYLWAVMVMGTCPAGSGRKHHFCVLVPSGGEKKLALSCGDAFGVAEHVQTQLFAPEEGGGAPFAGEGAMKAHVLL